MSQNEIYENVDIGFLKCEKCEKLYMVSVNGIPLREDDLHFKCPHPTGENNGDFNTVDGIFGPYIRKPSSLLLHIPGVLMLVICLTTEMWWTGMMLGFVLFSIIAACIWKHDFGRWSFWKAAG